MLADNQKARELGPDFVFTKIEPGEGQKLVNSQEWFMKHAMKTLKKKKIKMK
jgi:polyphosphate kinase